MARLFGLLKYSLQYCAHLEATKKAASLFSLPSCTDNTNAMNELGPNESFLPKQPRNSQVFLVFFFLPSPLARSLPDSTSILMAFFIVSLDEGGREGAKKVGEREEREGFRSLEKERRGRGGENGNRCNRKAF